MDANKAFWIEFFEMYRAFPCLWKVKCPEYSNRNVKNHAYDILVDKFKEIYSDANKQLVLKKINIIRTCYRREAKKVRDSEKSDSTDGLYVPNLWYFDLLSFLADQDDVESSQRVDGAFSGEEEFLEEMQSPPLDSPCKKIKREELKQLHHRVQEKLILQRRQERLIQQQKDRIAKLRQQHQSKKQEISPRQTISTVVQQARTDDETTTISSTWGILYRDLEPRQKLYANKAITEVLYQGALGKLHEYSYKAVESQQMMKKKEENPLGITIDRISYNDPEYQHHTPEQIANISDALNYLKPLEEFAVRENHAAMGLISQLEETLRSFAEDSEEYYKYN